MQQLNQEEKMVVSEYRNFLTYLEPTLKNTARIIFFVEQLNIESLWLLSFRTPKMHWVFHKIFFLELRKKILKKRREMLIDNIFEKFQKRVSV